MVMISLKEPDLTTLSWILTHRSIINLLEMIAPNILIILKKLEKGAKKAGTKRVIRENIDVLIDFYPKIGRKRRVKTPQ